MSEIAIRVERLGKQYRIGKRERYRTLRDTVTDTLMAPFVVARAAFKRSLPQKAETSNEQFWALRDVSFEVPRGGVVGIIGRNGAGKSTLLKILSRITEPTEGRVEVHGRVGSLLEVGTGFHPELTGRENIFLNGAILGMRRAEIARKFDEIVAFAEIESFIDTPVKHYSSGMYMRLAFAVAAHLEPEILVIDEVLAVGDSQFQKRCLGKMGEVARQGRTVLFVSHNLPSVESLCSECVLLRQGKVDSTGSARTIISSYLTQDLLPPATEVTLFNHPNRRAGSIPIMSRLRMTSSGQGGAVVPMGGTLVVEVGLQGKTTQLPPVLGIVVKNSSGSALFGTNNLITGDPCPQGPFSNGTVRATYRGLPLMPGTYVLDLYLDEGHATVDAILDAAVFEVTPADVYGTGRLSTPSAGPFWVPVSFEVLKDEPQPELLATGS